MPTHSILSKVIEFQGHDTKIFPIMDRVQSGTCEIGWAIHIVVVP